MNEFDIMEAVSFPVKMMDAGFKDNLGNWVNIPDRKVIVRTDSWKPMGIHSDQYKLIPYEGVVRPLLMNLGANGAQLTTRQGRGIRCSPLRVEGEGKRIWIESAFPDHQIRIGNDLILPRLVYGNSYDGTASYRGIMGFFQVSCTNIGALIKPGALKGFGGGFNINRRHIGGEDIEPADIGKHIKSFLASFGNMAESLQGMLNSRVTTEKAREIMTTYAGSRFVDKHYRDDAQSAWELYAKVTNYLTFDYKGGTQVSERRAALALAEIQREMR